MNLDVQFRPDWSSAPGETIVDFLQEHNLGVQDFAERMGQSVSDATDLLQGRTPITLAVARQLSSVCGASVEFWMSRDLQYRDDTARVQAADDEWLRELPIGDMVDFGWLAPPRQAEDRISACLRFFNAPTVRACRQAYGAIQEMAAFRTSPSFPSLQAPVAVWLRRGELEAAAIACESWDPEGLRASLPAVRSLTRRKDPQVFLPDLQDVCAGSGVAVTVVRAPNGCRASGASRFVSPEKAVLQFSFRYLTDDQFWFTFFHEVGHLLLHGKAGFFLEGDGVPQSGLEEEANRFASEALIPAEARDALMRVPSDGFEVIRFARRLGISPGIVVGQLQHYGKVRYNQLNNLKRRFKWSA